MTTTEQIKNMTLYEQIKKACIETNASHAEIGSIFGVSANTVAKVRELSFELEQTEHPERFDKQGLRKD
jgi:hypothetical protein